MFNYSKLPERVILVVAAVFMTATIVCSEPLFLIGGCISILLFFLAQSIREDDEDNERNRNYFE